MTESAMRAVKENGLALQSSPFINDKEVVMAAVRKMVRIYHMHLMI